MTETEALMRVKTGNFGGDYGFDMQLLVDAVGIIGEMFKSGQISEVVRCKDCGHAQEYNKRWVKPKEPDKWWCFVWEEGMDACDFCSLGERRESDGF